VRIMILGFGTLARKITDKVKTFPEYGFHKKVAVGHIMTRINSLSYGKDLVVEIPDPHGDGYRTYNDGFQALDNYSTTVSNYKEWLMEQASSNSFNVLIDCTSKNQESEALIEELKSNLSSECLWIAANETGDVDSVISQLRLQLTGSEQWEPVEHSQELLDEAAKAWEIAQRVMADNHIKNRERDIEKREADNAPGPSRNGYESFGVIPPFDRGIIDRFIVNNEDHKDFNKYNRKEVIHESGKYLTVTSDLLTSFFGWHHTEQVASRVFGTPYLEVKSAIYIKYLEDEVYVDFEPDEEYVVEYVYNGTLEITHPGGLGSQTLDGSSEGSAYGYIPDFNPPDRKKVHAGLEIIIFTYRSTDAD